VYSLKNGDVLVALGMGSIFNHDKDPNVDYRVREDENCIEYFAVRCGATGRPAEGRIEAGEELCIYYGHRPEWDVYTESSDDESV
jgi:SET domain-containing protein